MKSISVFLIALCLFLCNNKAVAQKSFDYNPSSASPSLDLLPTEASELISKYEEDKKPIQEEARKKIHRLQLPLIASLKELQDRYTREAKLDEAVAIRNWVRYLQQLVDNVFPDPGNLMQFHSRMGEEFNFRVTGRTNAAIWGTDVYTTDSALAVAAVHAGALRDGETGIVKVTILPGMGSYQGSIRNNVNSNSWQKYPVSYKVEKSDKQIIDNENKGSDTAVEAESDTPIPSGKELQLNRNYNRKRPGF